MCIFQQCTKHEKKQILDKPYSTSPIYSFVMLTVIFTWYFQQSTAVQGMSVAADLPKTFLMLHSYI